MKKTTKKEIREFLDNAYLNITGLRKINGGYAETKIGNWKQKGDLIRVKGILRSGTCDCGDGHSEMTTDELDVTLQTTKNGLTFANKEKCGVIELDE